MQRNRRKGSRHIIRNIFLLILGAAALFTASLLVHKVTATADIDELILVNADHPFTGSDSVALTQLSNGETVATAIYPALQQMFDDARANGVYPVVASGYRTAEEQQSLMAEKIASYVQQGYSEAEAKELAAEYVSSPETSEHRTGLAVDINADPMKSTAQEVYTWLAANAYRYGFILRYPKDKEEITGIHYEAWHYRYVGKEAAKAIYEQGLCLEEYLEQTGP